MTTALAHQIREARKHAGLTQEQLAEQLHTSRFRVLEWEKGKHRPAPATIARIAEVTGQRISEEYGAADDEEAAPDMSWLRDVSIYDVLLSAARLAKERVPA